MTKQRKNREGEEQKNRRSVENPSGADIPPKSLCLVQESSLFSYYLLHELHYGWKKMLNIAKFWWSVCVCVQLMDLNCKKILSSNIQSVNIKQSRECSDSTGTTVVFLNGCNVCHLLFRIPDYLVPLLHQFYLNSHLPFDTFSLLFVAFEIVLSFREDAHQKVFFRLEKGRMFLCRGIVAEL